MDSHHKPTIQVATRDDVSDLAHIHLASWQVAYRGILPDEVLDNLFWGQFETRWKFNFFNTGRTNLIMEVDGRATGFSSLGANRDATDAENVALGEIYALYLHPDFWGAGYGRLLWQHTISFLQPHYPAALIWVLKANTRARNFYERMGCHKEEQIKIIQLYGVNLPEVCYRLDWAT